MLYICRTHRLTVIWLYFCIVSFCSFYPLSLSSPSLFFFLPPPPPFSIHTLSLRYPSFLLPSLNPFFIFYHFIPPSRPFSLLPISFPFIAPLFPPVFPHFPFPTPLLLFTPPPPNPTFFSVHSRFPWSAWLVYMTQLALSIAVSASLFKYIAGDIF